MVLRLAQISDAHLLADPAGRLKSLKPLPRFEQVLAAVVERAPDWLLLTGDLSDDGSRESYEMLAGRLRAAALPSLAIAGNHDHPARLQAHLAGSPFHPDAELDLGDWLLLALNSAHPPRIEGWLEPEQLAWMEQRLVRDRRPTIVVLHHPPLAIGCSKLDPLGLLKGPALQTRLAGFPQVQLCLFGHIHQPFEQRLGSVTYLGAPSCFRQFAPRAGEVDAAQAPPGYRWLELHPDGTWTTQVVWLDP